MRPLWLSRYFNDTSTAITNGALFDTYLQLRSGGSTVFVGEVESIRGIAALLMAVPIGLAADKYSRDLVLKVNWRMGICAVVMLLVGLPLDLLWLTVSGSVLLSIHNQCLFGLLPVIASEVAQSKQDRTRAITGLATANTLGSASGPALQLLLMLVAHEDSWSTRSLHLLLVSGFPFFLAYGPCLLRVTFLYARRRSSASDDRRTALTTDNSIAPDNRNGSSSRDSASTAPSASPTAPHDPVPTFNWVVAGLLETSSLITAIGSGMTFKYWPLFFKHDFKFQPSAVCALQLGIYVCIATGTATSPALTKFTGRLPAANLFHITGTFLLFLIATQRSLSVYIEVPLVLLRNAIMNCSAPLLMATVLELVPSQHQGKWSQIMSLRRMTWSGSALLGGLLSDSHDFRYAFFITACVHTVAGLLLLIVNVLVIVRDRRKRRERLICEASPAGAVQA